MTRGELNNGFRSGVIRLQEVALKRLVVVDILTESLDCFKLRHFPEPHLCWFAPRRHRLVALHDVGSYVNMAHRFAASSAVKLFLMTAGKEYPLSSASSLEDLIRHLATHLLGLYDPERNPQLIPSLLLRGAVPVDLCSDDDLCETLRTFQLERNTLDQRSLRVYREGELDEVAKARLQDTPIGEHESFEAWMRRVLPAGHRFGVIINGFERWSESVALRMRKIFAPLLEAWGVPQSSLELTLFAGDYGYTPFGIHVDDPFTQTIHFQFGPGSKTMTLWTPERFHELIGPHKVSRDYARLLPHGESTVLCAGDVYLLPAHYYHVGAVSEFSVGIAACIGRFTERALRARALQEWIASRAFTLFMEGPGKQNVLAEDLTVRAALNMAYQELAAGERSKAGFKHLARQKQPDPAINRSVQQRKDFAIEVLKRGSHLVLFARGHRLQVRALPAVTDLVGRLARAEWIDLSALDQLYPSALDRLAVKNLLQELEIRGALESLWHACHSARLKDTGDENQQDSKGDAPGS